MDAAVVCLLLTPTPTPCAVVVSNGKGGTYTDNCDGTVTDSSTGLVWSAYPANPPFAWGVDFSYGYVGDGYKAATRFVRAVRSGSDLTLWSLDP